ncbi:hypothetical protein [Segeticoccus rhizosphaerae]|jgi:hypothetical protein|uniref:hypothetical protein n=1 Tax=Segeticoccus rhizosphaerae TaxID=1104777 RepID=UPI0010C059A5|nr:hypothetical protein [Ornithinicoccus soli]
MGSFGWGDLIAVVAVLVSLASVVVTVRTSRDAEAAAVEAAKRQEHMARAFDELVAAAKRIADAQGGHHGAAARAEGPPAPQWQVENPSAGHYLLRNLSSSTRHDVRISFSGEDNGEPSTGVELPPLAAHPFVIDHAAGDATPQVILVSDAEHREPVEVAVERWF